MDHCLLDTSALSDVMEPRTTRAAVVSNHLRAYLRANRTLTFSEISCFEILRGLRKKNATTQLRNFGRFCAHSELLPITYPVLDQAAGL